MAKETAAALDEELEANEPTAKQIINEGITRAVESLGVDLQKSRYKAMRAIAFQAFLEAIESGDFDRLVDDAVANSDELPSGWEVERQEVAEAAPAKKAPAKKAPAKKAPAKKAPAAKAADKAPVSKKAGARRRPARAAA